MWLAILVAVIFIVAVAFFLWEWKNHETEEELTIAICSGGFACIMLILLAILLSKTSSTDVSDEVILYPQSDYQLEIKVHTTEYMNVTWSDTTYVIIKRDE